jgi:hypothetical protein
MKESPILLREPVEPRVRPTLHPLAVAGMIGAGLMLVLLVVGIGMLIVILQDSRDHIRAQDAKTAVLLGKLRAAEPTTRAALREARPAVRSLGRSIGPVRKAVGSTAIATERIPVLVRVTEALAGAAFPVLGDLQRADVAQVLAEVRAQNLIPASAEAARETPGLIRRLVRLQTTTLRTQRVTLQTLLASLEVQRQTLESVKSIDRKTGGTVPAQGAPVPAP